jgi:hypothetical protein
VPSASQDFEYDIYVPIYDNQGKKYPEDLLESFKKRLIDKFGGLTDTRFRNEGTWKTGRVIQHDEIVIWKALSQGSDEKDYMIAIKNEMRQALAQDEILIIQRQVEAL